MLDAEYNLTSGELVEEAMQCFICRGVGAVYVYPTR
jgi:hypothetical protein